MEMITDIAWNTFKKTGDIKGNTESLIRNLKTINYPSQTSFCDLIFKEYNFFNI